MNPLLINLVRNWHLILKYDTLDLPDSINIVTSTACTRHCHYCIQGRKVIKQQLISPSVWNHCIDLLKEFKWKGVVGLGGQCEPSISDAMDGHLRDLKKLGVFTLFLSNGDRPERLKAWLEDKVLDRVLITQHDVTDKEWLSRIAPLKKKWPLRVKFGPIPRYTDWAGQVNFEGAERVYLTRCKTNSHSLTIYQDLSVGLCCWDVENKYPVGSIENESIASLWFSPRYRKLRDLLMRGYPVSPLCKYCFNIQ